MTGIPQDRQHLELRKLNRRVSITLRICTSLSLLLILAGPVLAAIRGVGIATSLTPVTELPAQLVQLDPTAFITSGIMLIMLLPVAIIIISLAHFVTMRERNPIIACVILLTMLAVSFIFIVK